MFKKGSTPTVKSFPGRLKVPYSGFVIPESGELFACKPETFSYETMISSIRGFLEEHPASEGKKYALQVVNQALLVIIASCIKKGRSMEFGFEKMMVIDFCRFCKAKRDEIERDIISHQGKQYMYCIVSYYFALYENNWHIPDFRKTFKTLKEKTFGQSVSFYKGYSQNPNEKLLRKITEMIQKPVEQTSVGEVKAVLEGFLKEDSKEKFLNFFINFNNLYGEELPLFGTDLPSIDSIRHVLESNGQVILYGPPGTGKTRRAKIVAACLLSGKTEKDIRDDIAAEKELEHYFETKQYRFIQFHQSYSYERFIGGIEANTVDGSIDYRPKDGVVREIAKAGEKNKDQSFVLLIDEINRAPVSVILGELLYALENRSQLIYTSIPGKDNKKELFLPKKLFIIGTMNTADISLSSIDYALRRRFAFVNIPSWKIDDYPEGIEFATWLYNVVASFFGRKGDSDIKDNCVLVAGMNGEDFCLGPSFFLYNKGDDDHLKYKLCYEIIPMLREYYRDGLFRKKKTLIDNKNKTVTGKSVQEVFCSDEKLLEYLIGFCSDEKLSEELLKN